MCGVFVVNIEQANVCWEHANFKCSFSCKTLTTVPPLAPDK